MGLGNSVGLHCTKHKHFSCLHSPALPRLNHLGSPPILPQYVCMALVAPAHSRSTPPHTHTHTAHTCVDPVRAGRRPAHLLPAHLCMARLRDAVHAAPYGDAGAWQHVCAQHVAPGRLPAAAAFSCQGLRQLPPRDSGECCNGWAWGRLVSPAIQKGLHSMIAPGFCLSPVRPWHVVPYLDQLPPCT